MSHLKVLIALILAHGCIALSHKHAPPPALPPPSPKSDHAVEWDLRTFTALVAAALACALSMSAGVGGGGVLVPIFNIILGLGVKPATGLSQAVIAAAGIGSAFYSLTHPHPYFPWRPLIDFQLVLVLTPALLLGVSFGVLANAVSPGWLVTASIIVVLSYMANRTLKLALRLRKTEQEAAAMEALHWSGEEVENSSDCVLDDRVPTIVSALRQWARPTLPLKEIAQVLLLWVVFACIQLEKGKYGRCTWPYALLYAAQVAIAAASTLYFVHQAVAARSDWGNEEWQSPQQQPLLAQSNGEPVGSPLSVEPISALSWQQQQQQHGQGFSERRLNFAAGTAVSAGALAGLIGMGGGFLLNPLLLEFGIHPQVAAATSSLMVLFSSASATVAFVAEGRLDIDLAMIFGLVCCISAFIGVYALAKLVKKRGASVVVFLLAGVIAVGVIATATFDGYRVVEEYSKGKLPGFQPFCRPPVEGDINADSEALTVNSLLGF